MGGIQHWLVMFLLMVLAIVIIAALIWAVETYIIKAPLPQMVRLVLGLVIIILVILWFLNGFSP